MQKTLFSIVCIILICSNTVLRAQQNFVYPSEDESLESLLLVWDYSPTARDSVTAELVNLVQDHAHVYLAYYPGTAPVDTNGIRDYLITRGVADSNYTFIPIWTETLWVRDYGPFVGYLYNETESEWERHIINAGYSTYNRPNDDDVPNQMGAVIDAEITDLPLELEGGNLLFDGLGRAICSRRIVYEQNPQFTEDQVADTLRKYFNLTDVVFLDVVENSGGGIWAHVDMYIKIIDHETIMITEYPDTLPDYNIIENNVATLAALDNGYGRPYEIVRIPAPVLDDGTYATSQWEEMRTYANSFTINDLVVMPAYQQALDSVAISIYEEAMPGYTILPIDARCLTPLYGAIHCITNEIPPAELLRMIHAKITGLQDTISSIEIACRVQASETLEDVLLYYKNPSDSDYQSVPLSSNNQVVFSMDFTDFEPGDTVQYYLAANSLTATRYYPAIGDKAPFSFWLPEEDSMVVIEDTMMMDTTIMDTTVMGLFFNNIPNMSISPNPSSTGYFQLIFTEPYFDEINIYDANGKSIFKGKSTGLVFEHEISTKGFYFIQTKIGNLKLLVE